VPKAKKVPPGPNAAKQPVSITVVLNYTDPRAFNEFAKSQERAVVARTFKPLTNYELTTRFGPTLDVYQGALTYFQQQGFKLVQGSTNRRTLTFTGTRAMAERAFRVKIADFRLGERTFFANTTEPSLPTALAKQVAAIWGLSTLGRPTHLMAPTPTPAALARAYGMNAVIPDLSLGAAGLDGRGQVIGLPEQGTFDPNDIKLFLNSVNLDSGLSHTAKIVPIGGGTNVIIQEATLDVETVLGIAPHLSEVDVFVAPLSFTLVALVNASITSMPTTTAARVISISYAQCESDLTTAQLDSFETTIVGGNMMGISIFAGSGDRGDGCVSCDASGGCDYASGPEFPASAPHVIAVGGTSLQVNSSGGYVSENLWTGPGVGGGFNLSGHFPRPAWQDLFTGTATRSIPDVCADANPDTGFTMCYAGACNVAAGGTSMATPIWAALWALVAQASGGRLQLVTPALLYSMAGFAAIHPSGAMLPPNNDFAHLGLGSPNIAAFVPECGNRQGEPCCNGATCTAAFACSQGTCACGGPGQPCCAGASCGASLTCAGNICTCGSGGQPCCAPNETCDVTFSCSAGYICHCGDLEEACCKGTSCNDTLLTCSVARGACISACGHKGQPCCTSVPSSSLPSSGGTGPGWCYSGEGVSCSNKTCACGGLNQACCRPGGTCGFGLTCTSLVCVKANATGSTCSTCNSAVSTCLHDCTSEKSPVRRALCQCACQVTACNCRTQNNCGVSCSTDCRQP
jgi:hypothetical protein